MTNFKNLSAAFAQPTYVYVIENTELGLFYIGKHAGTWGDTSDRYMGSSDYLNAIRSEFTEFTFEKRLIEQFSTDSEATKYETELITLARADFPEGLINRSANNGMSQWEHTGYGMMTSMSLKERLDKARRVVRPLVLKTGEYKNIMLIKKEDGTAHAPAMPQRNLTPIPKYGTWNKEMLEAYYSLPPGAHHFASVLDARTAKNYKPLAYVESFETEEQARIASSKYANMPSDKYKYLVETMLTS